MSANMYEVRLACVHFEKKEDVPVNGHIFTCMHAYINKCIYACLHTYAIVRLCVHLRILYVGMAITSRWVVCLNMRVPCLHICPHV